jgi:uncharacterized repeat protein (TIGR01451 family)
MIHWLDAQWQFPPPAINAAGTRHVFTTMVMRQSDQSPRPGWVVRYTISGGPPAAFAATGGPTVDVPTDATGRASAEIYQPQPTCGTNAIGILVIRPAGSGGLTGPLVVGSGGTSKTWSAPGLALRMSGPAIASTGATVTYRLELSNPGDLPVEGIAVADEIPEGFSFLTSRPPAEATGHTARWPAQKLAPGQCCSMELDLRADRIGSVTNCAEATAAGGLRSRECVTTTVSAALPAGPGAGLATAAVPAPAPPPASPAGPSPTPAAPPATPPVLEVKVTGPERVTVGETVKFDFPIKNTGSTTASGLEVRLRFDSGLEHAVAPSPIVGPLKDLQPGETTDARVEFRAIQAGKQCLQVEITGKGGVRATAEGCITVAEAPAPSPKAKPSPPPSEKLSLRVAKPDTSPPEAAPKRETKSSQSNTRPPALAGTGGLRMTLASLTQPARVGKEFTYKIEVTNPTPAAPSRNGGAGRPYGIDATNQALAVHDVAVTVTLPENLLPVALGTTPGDATIDGREVRFPPLANLFGGEPRVYYVRVLPQKPGDAKVRAQLTQRNSSQPILVDTVTQILP